MNYSDGQQVRLNDQAGFNGEVGVVVCSMDTDEYTDAYPRKDWEYLKLGVMVDFPESGLVYFDEADADLRLIARSGSDVG